MSAPDVRALDAASYRAARANAIRPAPAALPTVIPLPSDQTADEHAAMVAARNPKRAGEMTAAEYATAKSAAIRDNRR